MAQRSTYDEDYFADTRMSFGEHIEDLRRYLLRGVYGFVVAMVLSFLLARPAMLFINEPVEKAVKQFYDDRINEARKEIELDPKHPLNQPKVMPVEIKADDLAQMLKQLDPNLFRAMVVAKDAPPVKVPLKIMQPGMLAADLQPILQRFGKRPGLSSLSALEAFLVFLKVWMMLSLVLSSPWILYQIWSFVAAGLYPHERSYVTHYIPMSVGLFLAGVLMCQFLVIPTAIGALLQFNKWLNIEPDFRLTEWLSFAIWMPVITGICFETPLVMVFLGRLGICTSQTFLRYWRVAVFVMLVLAAFFAPTVDPLSLFFIWLPMCGLYFLGIWLVKRGERADALAEQEWEEEVEYQPRT